MNTRQTATPRGSMARMTKLAAAALATTALALTVGVAPAEAKRPPAKCRTIAINDVTGDMWKVSKTVTLYRQSYVLTERCRGRLSQRLIVSDWSPTDFAYPSL